MENLQAPPVRQLPSSSTCAAPSAVTMTTPDLGHTMDLSYSPEETAFRNEVRDWLAANLPADIRDKVTSYRGLSKDEYLRWHKILAAKGWSVPHWPVEWGGTGWDITQRYIYDEEFGLAGAPGLPPFGPEHVRVGAAALRHGRAEEPLPAAHPRRRRLLGAGLFRAGRRLRPGGAEDPRRTPRRPLPGQRPEDLDHAGPLRRLDLLPGAHRRRRPKSARKASASC